MKTQGIVNFIKHDKSEPKIAEGLSMKEFDEYIGQHANQMIEQAVIDAIIFNFSPKIAHHQIQIKDGLIQIDKSCGVTEKEITHFLTEFKR